MKRSKGTSDFPKKKKKLGKGKRPPDNVTRVSFKSQSVVVTSQLDTSSAEGPSTYRKLSFQDLMKQLNHPKPSVCTDAINGIRELLMANHTHLLIPNLNSLIYGLKSHLVNFDDNVRHSLYLLLKYIFQSIPSQYISPYMDILVAAVKCAITHVNQSIQIFGIRIMDLLITNYSQLLQGYTHQLLPCYLPLVSCYVTPISKTMKISHQGGSQFKKDCTKGSLNTAPHNSLAKQSARFLIFKQILQFLNLESKVRAPPTVRCAPPIIDICNELVCSSGNLLSHPLCIYEFFSSSNFILKLSYPSRSCTGGSLSTRFSDIGFINQLIKLLLEYWLEVIQNLSLTQTNSKRKKRKQKALNETFGSIEVILNSFCLILSSFDENISFSKDNIVIHFLPYFPLPPSAPISLNLQFCYLLVLTDTSNNTLQSVTNYFSQYIFPLIGGNIILQNVQVLEKILTKLSKCDKNSNFLIAFYGIFVKLFIATPPTSSTKRQMLLYLEQLLNQQIQSNSSFSDSFKQSFFYLCLSTLPDLLLKLPKQVDHVLLSTILKLLNQSLSLNIDPVQISFVNNFSDIYSPNGFISTVPVPLLLPTLHLIGYTSSLTNSELSLLSSIVLSNKFPPPSKNSLIFLLDNKLRTLTEDARVSSPAIYPTLLARHISFLLSILLGYTIIQLRQLSDERELMVSQIVIQPTKERIVNDTLQIIANCLLNISLPEDQLLLVIQPNLVSLIKSVKVLPIDLIYNLLYFFTQLKSCANSFFSNVISPLFFSCLVAMETNSIDHVLLELCHDIICRVLTENLSMFVLFCEHMAMKTLSDDVVFVFAYLVRESRFHKNLSSCKEIIGALSNNIEVYVKSDD